MEEEIKVSGDHRHDKMKVAITYPANGDTVQQGQVDLTVFIRQAVDDADTFKYMCVLFSVGNVEVRCYPRSTSF